MEVSKENLQMLEQFDKPAFFTDDATVLHVNSQAKKIGICEGQELSSLFDQKDITGSNNAVFFTKVHGIDYNVSSAIIGDKTLYTLDSESYIWQLQSVIRAAQQLRVPLSGLTSTLNLLKQNTQKEPLYSNATKHLMSLQRAVRNMSDASLFLEDRSSKKETVNISAYFIEIAGKLQQHFSDTEISISYAGLDEQLYCNIDAILLDRAIYNMVSNSLKAGSKNLTVTLKKKEKYLYLTVADDGCGMTEDQKSHILNQFKAEPNWIAQSYGLGLGMMIVYAAAKAHNGTLLISDNEPHGCKITLTLAIEKGEAVLRQKPIGIYVDPLGGADALLLELSDVLPAKDF